MVFANSKTDYQDLPAGAKAAQKQSGNTIPMVFVTTADGSESIRGISYDKLKNDIRDVDRELRKQLETVDVIGSSSGETEVADAAETVDAMLSEARAWTNSDGKTITAAVKAVNDTSVTFVINGNEVPYPLANLSADSRMALKELVNQ